MIEVGIIGGGRIGQVHATSIFTRVPNAHVKTLADEYLNENIEKFAAANGVGQCVKDYHEILNDPEIDAVLICTPTPTHTPISIEAIEAGKNVFCEKPIDHEIENINKVIEALKGSKVKYQVGFNRRFDHNFKAVKQASKDGKVGKTEMITIQSRDPEPPPIDYVKISGGIFLDMMIHDFDMARFLADCEPVEVYAEGAVLVDKAIGEAGDVDTALVTMRMEDGSLVSISNSRRAAYGYDQQAEIFGSKGAVKCGNDASSQAVLSDENGVTAEKPLFFFLERYMDAYADEIKQFIDAVENDTDTPVNVMDGLEAVRIGIAATKSCKEHRPVKMSEI
ncbi:MAG: inositol 2-dehydrogenase [Coriobacteriia bacterium]|nr:inositol 2-dehydrogenase [Coriobacteriia bacterium]